jgi:hypothetical protein
VGVGGSMRSVGGWRGFVAGLEEGGDGVVREGEGGLLGDPAIGELQGIC